MRPFTTVHIRDHSDRMIAHIILYTQGHISGARVQPDNTWTSLEMTNSRFEEWFSFALFIGYRVTVMVRDADHKIRNVVTF